MPNLVIENAAIDLVLLKQVEVIAKDAGKAIRQVDRSAEKLDVEIKADDSPLTQADLASHRCICDALAKISTLPILSEESTDISVAERRSWQSYWLIDPLDGTKEFVAGTDEFTVNIALIHQQQVVLGVVYVPMTDTSYAAVKGLGAFKQIATAEPLPIKSRRLEDALAAKELIVVGSRRHGSEALGALVEDLSKELCPVSLQSRGSSLKFCMLAEGLADIYPRLALTCEWDTAAAQIVLEEAGGAVLTPNMQPMLYNSKDELLNPYFWAIANNREQWQPILEGRIKNT